MAEENLLKEDDLIEMEARILEQEHRIFQIIYNFFVRRKTFPKGDPRRKATFSALLWGFFSPRTAATAGISVAAILGLVLAYQANVLLSRQNERIDIQNQLSEASRRASLIFELTSINERIDDLRKVGSDEVTLPASLIGRIVALSRSLRPYQYVITAGDKTSAFGTPFEIQNTSPKESTLNWFDKLFALKPDGVRLTKRPLSPERGQLLITLVSTNITNFSDLVEQGIDFRYADLRGVTLRNADLSGADLQYADFQGANLFLTNFSGADLANASFDGASMLGTKFNDEIEQTKLDNASFVNSRLNRADFTGAFMEDTDFSGAVMFDSILDNSIVSGATLEGTIICQISEEGDAPCLEWLQQILPHREAVTGPINDQWEVVLELVKGHPFTTNDSKHYVIRTMML